MEVSSVEELLGLLGLGGIGVDDLVLHAGLVVLDHVVGRILTALLSEAAPSVLNLRIGTLDDVK